MPGRGVLTVTGQMGDVMRESTQAALAIVRSRAVRWAISPNMLAKTDIHVHVPAAAVPKDGPSAGVAMLASLYSLLKNQTADPSVAMTGEITLRGLVLPVGGIKEKVLAGHRAGMKTIILPARNEPDLFDVPTEVKSDLRFVFAETIEDVLSTAIPGYRATGSRPREGGGGNRRAKAVRASKKVRNSQAKHDRPSASGTPRARARSGTRPRER
jgi:ATP-dependent Lon protease